MKKFLAPLIGIFLAIFMIGTGYAAWTSNSNNVNTVAQIEVLPWSFNDSDFAKIDNVSNLSYLTATQETSIVSASNEAVRLTNTAGTQSKEHSFILATDREYTVGEIKVMKVAFDYYHAQKRQQVGKGFPKVQLCYNGSGKGNTQGGGDTVNSKSVFTSTLSQDGNWWHLEYFITALTPTMADHGDSPISVNQKINGIKIIDSNIYDYNGNTAFIVVDNVEFSNTLSDRLGIFNKGTSFSNGGYYWFKIAWTGTLNSCVMTFSDDTVAEQDLASTKSPFYIHGLKKGTVTVTATLDLGESHQILSISNTLTVN